MSTSARQSPATLKFRAFIDAVLAIAWSALPDGSLDFINQRFRDYTGLSSDQLIGWEWKSVVHPDDIQKLGTWWQDVRQSEKRAACPIRPEAERRSGNRLQGSQRHPRLYSLAGSL